MSKILAAAAALAAALVTATAGAVPPAARADVALLPALAAGDRVLVADVSSRLSQAQLVGAPPATQRMRIGLALAHPDPAGEDALLEGLFDRSSAAYHQFLTPAQYARRFGVPESTQRAVRTWLEDGGLRVEQVTGAGDYVLASGTVTQVQALLKTTIRHYDVAGERFDANATPPAVPRRLPIFDVLGLDSSRRHRTMADLNGVAASPNLASQSPEDLRSIYEHPDGIDGDGVSVAILGNGATDSVIADLHAFDDLHGLPQVPVDVVRTPGGGDFSDTSGNIEWNIDMQAIHGMAPRITRQVLYFSPSLADSELIASLGTWVNDPNGPPIMNASLGECEQVPVANPVLNNAALDPINGNQNPDALPASQSVSQASQPTTTMLLQQAVMEGRTFFAASGDNGSSCSAANPPANGVANDGLPLTSDPANTPFSTGVGGTVLYSDGQEPAARFEETAWTHSGGNPSPFITAPDYQHGVPNLSRSCVVDSNGQQTNTGQLCRGVPDVAAISGDLVSNGYTIVADGEEASGAGTSVSSPLWAGMWADVASTAVGTTGYGFANRAIYAIAKDASRYGQAFHDITTGTNGANAALPGYDYVTGFGVPRLAGLIDQVQQVSPLVGRRTKSRCRDRSGPVSQFTRGSLRASKRRLVLAGTSRDRGCRARGKGRVARVTVAVARVRGRRCAFLRGRAGFSSTRSCARATYVTARGTSRWRLTLRRRLAPGSYRAYVRAVDAAGNVGKRKALRFRVR